MTVEEVLAELRLRGKESTRKIYSRHGHPIDRLYGTSVADIKLIAKMIRGQQQVAMQLFDSGIFEAMYLAGVVAKGGPMTEKQLRNWARNVEGFPMIAEHTVPWVAVENTLGEDLATEWIDATADQEASCGWSTLSGVVAVTPDEQLDMEKIDRLLNRVCATIALAPNRTKLCMNGYVINVGYYVAPLHSRAKEVAEQVGTIEVDMGDTSCRISNATESILKAEAMNRVGLKRKTIRC